MDDGQRGGSLRPDRNLFAVSVKNGWTVDRAEEVDGLAVIPEGELADLARNAAHTQVCGLQAGPLVCSAEPAAQFGFQFRLVPLFSSHSLLLEPCVSLLRLNHLGEGEAVGPTRHEPTSMLLEHHQQQQMQYQHQQQQ